MEGSKKLPKVVVYTCAVGNCDWIHRPRVTTGDIEFIRFSDQKPWLRRGWQHRQLPEIPDARTPRVLSRFPKLRPMDALSGADIAVWIDSSVEITGDITPLIRCFDELGSDIALFPHPSGRTVNEEFDFAIAKGKIPPEFHEAARKQRDRYEKSGLLDHKIVEATIILYRLSRTELRQAGQAWWQEITSYTERDQVSQPFAMRDKRLRIHLWDWHFDDPNPYFRRMPHRPKPFVKRLKTGAHFLGDSRLDYRLVRSAIRAAGALRRTAGSLRFGP